MTENEIGDLLVNNLSILNPSYKLLKREAYLPSEIGTKSFIDILASDNKNKFIIIELKKSNASAREAIHELFKYLEAVKENLSAKTDEIELVVVSTEWKELFVPFSSFITNSNLKAIGYELHLNNNNNLSATLIETDPVNEDRILSAIQMARYYVSQDSLNKGIENHINFFLQHGIENYVLIILKSPENYRDMVIQSVQSFILENIGEAHDFENNLNGIPDLKYMIYSANQLLSLNKYKELLSNYDDCDIEEINEIVDNSKISQFDKLEQFNDMLIETEPFPDADYVEIGTPAKYRKFREREGWELIEIRRFGSLAENKILTDEQIEEEILGASGTTGETFRSIIDLSNKANIHRVKKEISNCLSDNIVWKNHIFEIFDSLSKEDTKEIKCSVFNPMNIIRTIYLVLTRPDGMFFIPSYQIEVTFNNERRIYIGYLDGVIKNLALEKVFNKFWEGGGDEYLLSLTSGGYTNRNVDICDFIGLKYKTMMASVSFEEISFFDYREYQFKPMNPIIPPEHFYKILTSNSTLVPEIISFHAEHDMGYGILKY